MPKIKPNSATDELPVRFAVVDREHWPDLERLFEQRGGPHYCWCMVWRDMSSRARGDKSEKKAELRKRVVEGVPVGILGYLDDQPAAWCSVGPRLSFRRLVDHDPYTDAERVWSITCFFVRRRCRRQGLASHLIDRAVSYARSNGADVVEAYPVDKSSPSYRFMGFVPQFERAGFVAVGMAGTRRTVMQLRGC